MKIYKNFDEIRGKVKKTTEKILRKFKKELITLNIAEILKKVAILRKFSINFGLFKILKKF